MQPRYLDIGKLGIFFTSYNASRICRVHILLAKLDANAIGAVKFSTLDCGCLAVFFFRGPTKI